MREELSPAVYILANRYRGTIYVGVTGALGNRIWEHKNERYEGFSKAHGLKTLVWYEHHPTMESAIRREKLLKKWHRAWKFRIIETLNPDWLDLHDSIDPVSTLVNDTAGPRSFALVTVFRMGPT